MYKRAYFIQWSKFFKSQKWSILEAIEKGGLGRSQFEIDAFEWPVFLAHLKFYEIFIKKNSHKEFIPKGELLFSLSGHENICEIFDLLFFPSFLGNQVTLRYSSSLTYLVELFKRELKNDFLLRKIKFIQNDESASFKKYEKNFSLSVLSTSGVTDKDIDHLIWAAFYGSGVINHTLKVVFIPEEKLSQYVERFSFVMDQNRAPYLHKDFRDGLEWFDNYKHMSQQWLQDINIVTHQSVFNKNFQFLTFKKLKDLQSVLALGYGPYFILCGFRYTKTLVEKLNENSINFQSASIMGEWSKIDKKELESLNIANISYNSHPLFDLSSNESRILECCTQLTTQKKIRKSLGFHQALQPDYFNSWKNSKLTQDMSRFRKALPGVSRKIIERIKSVSLLR